MNTFFEQMMNDPMFWKIASVIIILILVASFKKLFKLASLLFFIIVVYAGYLIMTGTEPDEIVEQLQESSEDVWDKAEDSFDDMKDFTEDVITVNQFNDFIWCGIVFSCYIHYHYLSLYFDIN